MVVSPRESKPLNFGGKYSITLTVSVPKSLSVFAQKSSLMNDQMGYNFHSNAFVIRLIRILFISINGKYISAHLSNIKYSTGTKTY